ncbi:hypothetical protein, partial [Vibrio kanaloae]|uniref:hypothetical protein n=1 Tax=Vibrio kanaloae TaxID=170673 RepID=UPI0019D2C722
LKQHPNYFNTLPLQNPVAFGRGGSIKAALVKLHTNSFLDIFVLHAPPAHIWTQTCQRPY